MNPIPLYNQSNISQQVNNDELCAICLDNINTAPIHTLHECNHSFHSNCLIESLRINKTCPLCRGSSDDRSRLRLRTNGMIFRHILSFSKSKNNKCNKLKSLIKSYERIRDSEKMYKNEYKQFMKSNKDIIQKKNYLSRKKWIAHSKLFRIKREILSLPIIPINKK
jgi:hypothetical protein